MSERGPRGGGLAGPWSREGGGREGGGREGWSWAEDGEVVIRGLTRWAMGIAVAWRVGLAVTWSRSAACAVQPSACALLS